MPYLMIPESAAASTSYATCTARAQLLGWRDRRVQPKVKVQLWASPVDRLHLLTAPSNVAAQCAKGSKSSGGGETNSGFAWTSRRSMTLQSHSTEVTHGPPGTGGGGIVSAVAASAGFLPEIVMNEAGLKFGVPSAEFTMPFAPVPIAGRASVPVGVSETLLNLVNFPESARQAGSQ